MLIDNKRLLQIKNNQLLQKLQQINKESIQIVESKSGVSTLLLTRNGQQISYHSRYNPVQEAKAFIKSQLDETTEYVLLVGVGLGYSVQELKTNFPNVKFSVYEPDVEVMACFLENFDLTKVKSQKLDRVFSDLAEINNINVFYDDLAIERAKIIISPIAARLYGKEIENLTSSLKQYLSDQKSSVMTDLMFQLRWTMNTIVNFGEILKTPNLFKDIDISIFKDKPALVVAAGPSLDEEIENIRLIKEQGKAYVFAVGSAVNTLISADILPDALFSYDPSEKNAGVVKKVKELELSIPLLYGSSIGYEVLKNYPGNKVHFITTQDTINTNLIPNCGDYIIPDAPTISAVTLFVLERLGVAPIILVGQNLSITKEKSYASGIEYIDANTKAELLEGYTVMSSTMNNEIYVDQSYLEMRNAIQIIISDLNISDKVINTTKNGLPIEGTRFMPLNEVIEQYLISNKIVESDIFKGQSSYNIDEAIHNFEQLEMKFDMLIKNFKKVAEIEHQIINAYDKKLYMNAPTLFSEYDKYFSEIEHNEFFVQILSKITRVQYNQLLKDARKIREEKKPLRKMKMFVESYPKYFRALYVAIYEIQPAFAELKKSDLFKKEDSQ